MALTINNRALKIPEVWDAISRLEAVEAQKSPLNWIGRLQMVIQKSGTPQNIRWCFSLLAHLFLTKQLCADDFAVRKLAGQDGNGRGIVDLCCYKLELKDHMIDVLLPELAGESTDMSPRLSELLAKM